MVEPSILVYLKSDNSKTFSNIDFSKLYSVRDSVDEIIFLWDFNSYFVSVKDKYFIINGAKRIEFPEFKNTSEAKLVYARRNNLDVDMSMGNKQPVMVSYILGFSAKDLNSDIEKQILLHISDDGKFWVWKNSR